MGISDYFFSTKDRMVRALAPLPHFEMNPFGSAYIYNSDRYIWYNIRNEEDKELIKNAFEKNKIVKGPGELVFLHWTLPDWICLKYASNTSGGVDYITNYKAFASGEKILQKKVFDLTPVNRKLQPDEPIKAIIIDDTDIQRTRMMKILSAPSVRFEAVKEDPRELEMDIERIFPHLVLMDVYMEAYNGIEVLSRIRYKYPEICFIVMSSLGSLRGEALANGADEFIDKSMDESIIKKRVLRAVEQRFI